MAAGEKRATEIVLHYCAHGAEETCKVYGIGMETLSRYKRVYKDAHGNIPDLTLRMKEKYSDEEIEYFLSSDKRLKRHGFSKIDFTGDQFSFLALSDTHIGSSYYNADHLLAAFEEGKRQGCQFAVHSGDIVEGMSGRPGQIYELTDIGYTAQRNRAVEHLSQWGLPMYAITGNHDHWFNTKSGVGIDIGEDIEQRVNGLHYLGVHEGILEIAGLRIMLWHGEDASSYATSYRLQKIIEAFTGGEKPAILVTGHVHKQAYIFERNVHALSAGCIQQQSGFMRYKRLAAHCGFWIVNVTARDGQVIRFAPAWYPFY